LDAARPRDDRPGGGVRAWGALRAGAALGRCGPGPRSPRAGSAAVAALRIESSRNVGLRTRTRIGSLEGEDRLERVRWRHVETGAVETRPIRNLFVMTGADPNSSWLRGCLVLDGKNFVKTGADLRADELIEARWPLSRPPYLTETSIPGVFALRARRWRVTPTGGDSCRAAVVRRGATPCVRKRCTSSVPPIVRPSSTEMTCRSRT